MIFLFIVMLLSGSEGMNGDLHVMKGRYTSASFTFDTLERCEAFRRDVANASSKGAEVALISKCGTKDDILHYQQFSDSTKPLPAEPTRPGA